MGEGVEVVVVRGWESGMKGGGGGGEGGHSSGKQVFPFQLRELTVTILSFFFNFVN